MRIKYDLLCCFTAFLFHVYPAHAVVIQEDPGIPAASHIYPNESSPHYFKDVLSQVQGGTLISVGTFRSLIDAGLGQFYRLIMLDWEIGTTQFNRNHLALLKAIGQIQVTPRRQRYLYFAALHCGWLDGDQLALLESMDNAAEGPFGEAFISTFNNLFRNKPDCKPERFPNSIGNIMQSFQDSKVQGYDFPMSVPQGFLARYYEVESRPAFYWENDRDWAKIQDLVQNDRAVALVANLTGFQTIRSIGKFLRNNNENVSVIDVSSVLESWLYACHQNVDPEEREIINEIRGQYVSFFYNLRSLPLGQNTWILRTAEGKVTGAPRDENHLSYFWVKAFTYLASPNPRLEDWCAPFFVQ